MKETTMKATKKVKAINMKSIKDTLPIGERFDIIEAIVDFSLMNNKYDLRYLELAKVIYITLSYLDDTYKEDCPTDKDGNLDFLATYDKIMADFVNVKTTYKEMIDGVEKNKTKTNKTNLWKVLSDKEEVSTLLKNVDRRYEEKKQDKYNEDSLIAIRESKTTTEIKIVELLSELKDKFMSTMESINIKDIEGLMKNLPEMLGNMSPAQTDLVDKLTNLNIAKK